MGTRLAPTYFWIYSVIFLSWLLKLVLHPQPAVDISDLSNRAAIATIPGTFVIGINLLFYGFFVDQRHYPPGDSGTCRARPCPVKPDLPE